MDGIDLAREVKMRWPFLPVILTSGHPRQHVGKLPPGVAYLHAQFVRLRSRRGPKKAICAAASILTAVCPPASRSRPCLGATASR
jgi:hypothetical protein